MPNNQIFVLALALLKQGWYFRAKLHTTSNVGQDIISYEGKQRDEWGPEFAREIWVESSLAGEMRVITRWHWAMCLRPAHALILHSAENLHPTQPAIGWRNVFHKRAAVLAGEWQAAGSDEEPGTPTFQAPAGLWEPPSNLETLP